MVTFIDQHREVLGWSQPSVVARPCNLGVEPICKELPIAPSTYYDFKDQQSHPEKRSLRSRSDDYFGTEITRVYNENYQVYGARKVWRTLQREGYSIARCTVERLMQRLNLHGAIRGKVKRTTISKMGDNRPLDLVQREFKADRPNKVWVADFTYVATWIGFVYRRIQVIVATPRQRSCNGERKT